MSDKKVIYEVKHLQKSFGKVEVLRDINMKIENGEVCTIIGPSGSGKSTFLRCLTLLETPTGGELWFEGKKVNEKTDVKMLRRDVGMVFQSFNLFPMFSAVENVMYAPVHIKKLPKAEAKEEAMELLSRVGLAERADYYPGELSGGQAIVNVLDIADDNGGLGEGIAIDMPLVRCVGELFKRTDAAGKDEEGVSEGDHLLLADGHVRHFDELRETAVRLLFRDEDFRDDARHFAAGGHRRVSADAHQPDRAAAVNHVEMILSQGLSQLARKGSVGRIISEMGAAVDYDIFI